MLTLSPEFDKAIQTALLARGVNLEEPRELASMIKNLSDYFNSRPGFATPWDEPFAVPAYLAYFQPLNFMRLRAAWREVMRFIPAAEIAQIWDFGSGLGTTQWVLESETDFAPRPLFAIETSKRAAELHRELAEGSRWKPQFPSKPAPLAKALAVFSYSFLEMPSALSELDKFEHVLIVEPSTREIGRDLMATRARLLAMGFAPLAPCTHSAECPLLVHSQKDWCHMRIHFSAPDWFDRVESYLPMKNRTLTYSYLLMSKTVTDSKFRGAARVIGDTLPENGKTKQMICRGSKREFLSWLHRYGEPPRIPHGALVSGVDLAEEKGAELRVKPDMLEWTE